MDNNLKHLFNQLFKHSIALNVIALIFEILYYIIFQKMLNLITGFFHLIIVSLIYISILKLLKIKKIHQNKKRLNF